MRVILILALSLVLSHAHGQLIVNDPTNTIIQQIKNAADKIWQSEQTVKMTALVTNAIKTVNVLNETRELTGMAVASAKEMKELTKRFQDDFRSLSDLTGDDIKELNVLMSWRDALQGKGYQSIVDLDEYYEANTSQYRGSDGEFNLGSTLLNAVNDEDYLKANQGFYAHQTFYRRLRPLNYDYRIRELLRMAKSKENEARNLTLKLNLLVFGKNIAGLTDAIKVYKDEDGPKPQRNDMEISTLNMQIKDLLFQAGQFRTEALELMGYNMTHQAGKYMAAHDIATYRDKTFLEYQQMKYLEHQLNPNWQNLYQDSYYYNMNPTYDLSFK